MSFILNLILDQVRNRVTSWQTTIPAAFLASLTAFITNSGLFDPADVNGLAGRIAQWLIYGLSLVLLAWQDRKLAPEDKNPTQPPGKDQ